MALSTAQRLWVAQTTWVRCLNSKIAYDKGNSGIARNIESELMQLSESPSLSSVAQPRGRTNLDSAPTRGQILVWIASAPHYHPTRGSRYEIDRIQARNRGVPSVEPKVFSCEKISD